MEAVIALPRRARPGGGRARARARYECLQPYARRERRATARPSCSASASRAGGTCSSELVELRRRAGDYLRRDGAGRRGRVLLRRAERRGRRRRRGVLPHDVRRRAPASWNLRDRHMADTLDHLMAHLDRHGGDAPRGRLGAQLARRRRPRHRDGAARRAQHRPAHARAPRRATSSSSASPPTPAPSPPPRTGARPPSASACGRRSAGSYEALFHAVGDPAPSCSARSPAGDAAARCASPASSARSA